ncbi:KAP family P-loop NTPase fold protein [Candidatus Pantoea formicae]|uniref:KAP family P-loop NTPase fold protein n=1 Tax=Candidatus Pantoea formicae TaxID=2608355 RepID=UPI003ED89986
MSDKDMTMAAGNDLPVSASKDDRYGFNAVADGLTQSILALDSNVSTVIGIEGPWGAGKTSLMNLLMKNLNKKVAPNTHLLPFSPWLNAPGTSPIESLLLPVAAIIKKQEEKLATENATPPSLKARVKSKVDSGTALDVLNYIQQTSGRLAPLADFAGNFVPGLGMVAKGMQAFKDIELSGLSQTTAELQKRIEGKITELDLSFIVVIDDLDRLEPTQAVEVLRLVRSVAGFSRFRYVMCYDRKVLEHAIEQALGVADGRLYLQKIVPLSFSLPRPESFNLQRDLIRGAFNIYIDANKSEREADAVYEAIKRSCDVYGDVLLTPREVNQTLNAIRFRYPGLRDYVWFPDLFLLQLIRVVNPDLYDWAEHYLTDRAVIETRDGVLTTDEKAEFVRGLKSGLDKFRVNRMDKARGLSFWLPGINVYDYDQPIIFEKVSLEEDETYTRLRRLGSVVYWRYYFSFSSPQNVLTGDQIHGLLRVAASNQAEFDAQMLKNLTSNNITSRTWFEHIITRLTPMVTEEAGREAQKGILYFLFNNSDEIMDYFNQRSPSLRRHQIGIEPLAIQLIRQLLIQDREGSIQYLDTLFKMGKSTLWVASFARSLFWKHGLVGGRPAPEEDRFLSDSELESLRRTVAKRMDSDETFVRFLGETVLAVYLYAWQNISGDERLYEWLDKTCGKNSSFLKLLMSLRTIVTSSDKGVYHTLDLKAVKSFLSQKFDISAKLEEIGKLEDKNLAEDLEMVNEAIENYSD